MVLEEIDDDAVVVRVRATPDRPDEGAQLADEIIAVLKGSPVSTGGSTARPMGRSTHSGGRLSD